MSTTEWAVWAVDKTPDDLAEQVEQLRQIKASHEREAHERTVELSSAIRTLEAELLCRLGPGEATRPTSTGRFAFWATVAAGTATVRRDALDELADQLPPDCRPRDERVYPGVGTLRKHAKALREAGIRMSALLVEAPREPGVRWRTLSEEGDEG